MSILKSPSSTFLEILDSTNSSGVSAKNIGEIVSQDQVLARTVLRVANSRQRGLGREVQDPTRAALLLGATTIRHVALIHEFVISANEVKIRDREKLNFWEDCLRRASAANLLAHRYGAIHPDMAFAVGFALEFGRLSILSGDLQSTQSFGQVRALTGQERIDAEVDQFGASHIHVFPEMTQNWELPEVLTDALAMHHEEPETIRNEARQPLTTFIARWADTSAEVFTAKQTGDAFERAVTQLNEEAGMTKAEVEQFIDQISLQTIAYSNVLALPLEPQPTLKRLLSDAKARKDPERMSKPQLISYVETLILRQEELEDELQELRSHVLSMTQFDPLTGLPSRDHFMMSLRQEVARARRYDRPLSLVILDVDEFTEFNATHGQNAGDIALRKASSCLERVMRDSDFLARSGGDEFVFVLPETDSGGGRIFAERARACMEALKVDVQGRRLRLSACVCGISLESLTKEGDHEVLYAAALRAVKKLRERGPNRVSWVNTKN